MASDPRIDSGIFWKDKLIINVHVHVTLCLEFCINELIHVRTCSDTAWQLEGGSKTVWLAMPGVIPLYEWNDMKAETTRHSVRLKHVQRESRQTMNNCIDWDRIVCISYLGAQALLRSARRRGAPGRAHTRGDRSWLCADVAPLEWIATEAPTSRRSTLCPQRRSCTFQGVRAPLQTAPCIYNHWQDNCRKWCMFILLMQLDASSALKSITVQLLSVM